MSQYDLTRRVVQALKRRRHKLAKERQKDSRRRIELAILLQNTRNELSTTELELETLRSEGPFSSVSERKRATLSFFFGVLAVLCGMAAYFYLFNLNMKRRETAAELECFDSGAYWSCLDMYWLVRSPLVFFELFLVPLVLAVLLIVVFILLWGEYRWGLRSPYRKLSDYTLRISESEKRVRELRSTLEDLGLRQQK